MVLEQLRRMQARQQLARARVGLGWRHGFARSLPTQPGQIAARAMAHWLARASLVLVLGVAPSISLPMRAAMPEGDSLPRVMPPPQGLTHTRTWPGTLDLLTQADQTLWGVDASDQSGRVTHVGDVNSDGFDDLFISGAGGDGPTDGRENAGESYLVFGQAAYPRPSIWRALAVRASRSMGRRRLTRAAGR